MGNACEKLEDSYLMLRKNQQNESEETDLIAYTTRNVEIELVLKKDNPNYNLYMKYVSSNTWIRGEYEVEIDKYSRQKRYITMLYPSPKSDVFTIKNIVKSMNRNILQIIGDNNMVYNQNKQHNQRNRRNMKIGYRYKVDFEFVNNRRCITNFQLV
jgi:hypothetical protein